MAIEVGASWLGSTSGFLSMAKIGAKDAQAAGKLRPKYGQDDQI